MNKHAKRTVLVAGTCLSVMVAGFPGTLSASTGTMIAAQQTKSISGTIVDSNGIPVIGANVLVKGTTNGTITDIDGNFTLTVPAGAILQISFIGYNSQEVTVGEQTSFNVVFEGRYRNFGRSCRSWLWCSEKETGNRCYCAGERRKLGKDEY